MKGKDEVITEFNEYVNMTAEELESWLKSDDANSAGWPKDEAEGEDGETVGHDSGRKIVDILRHNPDKDPEAYTDEQVEHMRKVVAYCKRHIAQEKGANQQKSDEEVKKTKSYASLKNWGHDFLKAQGRDGHSNGSKKKGDDAEEGGKEQEEEEEGEGEKEDADEEAKTGDKRKKSEGEQQGATKKRETRQGQGSVAKNGTNGKKTGDDEEEGEDDNDNEGGEHGGEEEEEEEQGNGDEPKNGPSKGDTVSWNWGQGQPEGKVLDVKADKTEITTKRGSKVSRNGDEEDPAVVLDTGKSKAVKSAHELNET